MGSNSGAQTGRKRRAHRQITSQRVDEAIWTTLKLLCEFVKCQAGHAYALDDTLGLLQPTPLWFFEDGNLAGSEAITNLTPLQFGQCLPGRVWETLAPA